MQHEEPSIDELVERMSDMLSIDLEDPQNSQMRAALQGGMYGKRYDRLGEICDIDNAIKYTQMAISLSPEDYPGLPHLIGDLGGYYSSRFQRLNEVDDITKAIEYTALSLAFYADDDPVFSSKLCNLGVIHSIRFRVLGELDDLNKAIICGTRAVELASNDDQHLAHYLSGLGASYGSRFERLGALNDIEKGIEYGSRGVSLTPDDHPDLPSRLTNMGCLYEVLFEHVGEMDDLKKAIQYRSRAVELTPEDHPGLPNRLAGLGMSYKYRYMRLDKLDDLEKAIEYASLAVKITPEDHPDLSYWLANLATSYACRYHRLREPEDLEKVIKYKYYTVTLTPDDHPYQASRLAELGKAYSDRFELLGDQSDMEKAFEYKSLGLLLTPEGHPGLPLQHNNLALLHIQAYGRTGEDLHLKHALDSFREATRSLTGSPRDKFQYALKWAKLASQLDSLNAIEAYQTTMNLLPQFIWLGTTTAQRYQDLEEVQNLAVNAASVAIRSSNYKLALEWLEDARCVVWNQSLMLRSPLDELQSSYPEVAARLQTTASKLHSASSEPREPQTVASGSMNPTQTAQEHRRLAQEYSNLLSQARELPGFEDFLQPMKADRLVRAARYGPIVVINCHAERSDALVIFPGQEVIKHIHLADFTGSKAERAHSEMDKSLSAQYLRERGFKPLGEPEQKDNFGKVLALLWYEVVKPILDSLGYMNNSSAENMPHITWCPTGQLSFLPLHAAGDYDKPGSRVFDYVVSSYTPTLTALLNSTPTSLTHDSRMLAIAQPGTPGCTPLPGTIKELERIKMHANDRLQYSQLIDSQATTSVVLDQMEQHGWVHLACHAHQNVINATKSGFFLHNGTLDLAAINRRSFTKKGLAFLSACQTAKGDKKLPDEAVHLASGMLMAGYCSVIGTMWSVADDDAPFIADRVYPQLIEGGKLGEGEAGKALHKAVAELRERVGENKFGRWVPYIHIGS
ncbi:TPR-like protein [Rhizoctonia solani]|uniref:TPR-like protein n=1 Tax=Rhizoctonia solani TaxID=456999 RepID=A0A8H7H538_9AGAM|nr:TPR-like protein [Rhizoctonia solani]